MPDAIVISAAGLRVMKLLVGNPPQTVTDLIRMTGVTRTAVTEQLSELITAGFVERSLQRVPSRGRPRHLYKATETALLLLFANRQPLVMPAIWRAIRDVGGEELALKVLRRASRAMVEHYNAQITAKKMSDRLRQFVDVLNDEGSLLDAIEHGDGRWTLRRRSCPFVSMLDQHRSVCRIDRAVLSAAAGRDVHQIACRHDGAPCCVFQVTNGAAGH